jgi:hypothetical protein
VELYLHSTLRIQDLLFRYRKKFSSTSTQLNILGVPLAQLCFHLVSYYYTFYSRIGNYYLGGLFYFEVTIGQRASLNFGSYKW